MSCPYRNLFGAVGTGLHSYRVFDVAIVDVLLTVLAAYVISLWGYSFRRTLIVLFLTGIVLHRLFCVRTTVDRLLF